MSSEQKKRKKGGQNTHLQKRQGRRSFKEDQEIAQLEQVLRDGAPARGSDPSAAARDAASTSYAGARTFDELPLSQYTKDGLKKAKYFTLTAIQRSALPHALAGRDVLGAAKTGSGKTLTFLIPIVEKLYRLKWTALDGLGALVLTPTRELAVQIFEELKKVGAFHDLSAGLLIGGKNVADEASRLTRMNILVCTPGRLLQHMDETPGFDTSSLQVLVLDEADRILDMGFAATLDAIVANLPQERQTMLFSATQTKSVRDLARLSLTDPEYLAVHAEAAAPTPLKLQQGYMVTELWQKMDVMWSFIKTHLKAKTIIFLSTCKQVRFVFEAFRKLRPGVPLRCLHGGMKQGKRTGVFYEFCEAQAMVLIATDIAARGLDFPTVDWVLQGDCPEDAATYIHRVGRTARYMAAGHALLMLLPSEREGALKMLSEAKVPLTQIRPNPAKQQAVSPALQALLSKDQELKDFAQKSLVAYCRSVFLQPRKDVFDVAALPVEEFAASLGLASVPKLRFMRKVKGKQQVLELGGKEALAESDGEEGGEGGSEDGGAAGGSGSEGEGAQGDARAAKKRRLDGGGKDAAAAAGSQKGAAAAAKSKEKAEAAAGGKGAAGKGGASNKRKVPEAAGKVPEAGDAGDDDDDFLVVKKRDVFAEGLPEEVVEAEEAADGGKKKKKKKQKIKVGMASGQRVMFDEQGNALDPLAQLAAEGFGEPGSEEASDGEGAAAWAAAQAGAGAAGVGAGSRPGDGLYVVSARPEDRFKKAAELMRQRDREDRRQLKELKREMKLERKDRLRAAAAAEAGEEGGGRVVTLGSRGGAAAREDDDDDEEDGGYGGSEGSGSEEEGRQGRGRGARGGEDGSDEGPSGSGSEDGGDSSDDDGGRGGGRGRGAGAGPRPEVGHMGMARKDAAGVGAPAGAGAGAGAGGAVPKKAGKGAAGLSLAEQEAMALQLLGSRRPWRPGARRSDL
ncbi:hypothetical protein HYH03_011669 [Edaphochlamys debaryana]|uniref:ATP-dependent RNA helicase n=1 Tax=Edaphochlamys debaryana TaxID=47281 RepID=A0A836BVB3_9CHLO|nr:hypothetical protein HYH03_011669 [Edaphochlamys debaryana]|eukprot:KAG2489867.1 hypothetical protein HYH03_011669 [Edaphochlamys debaryana]